jgi:hypothetical protein
MACIQGLHQRTNGLAKARANQANQSPGLVSPESILRSESCCVLCAFLVAPREQAVRKQAVRKQADAAVLNRPWPEPQSLRLPRVGEQERARCVCVFVCVCGGGSGYTCLSLSPCCASISLSLAQQDSNAVCWCVGAFSDPQLLPSQGAGEPLIIEKKLSAEFTNINPSWGFEEFLEMDKLYRYVFSRIQRTHGYNDDRRAVLKIR